MFIHLSVDEHLGCFHYGCIQVFADIFPFLLSKYLRVVLLDHRVSIRLILKCFLNLVINIKPFMI